MSGVPSQRGRVGTVINGKWKVDARIGSGGMSTVYAATHKNNGSRAALKILHADLAREEEIKRRFLREGYVANQVRHPGIVEVIDDDVSENGDVFLVVELLEGDTLESMRTKMNGRIPMEQALAYGVEALDALSAAHGAGIIHRDLKPDNLFLTKQGRVKILDFGLARLLDGVPGVESTRAGVMLGTPEYMAPEQAAAQRDQIDAQSDVYGIGATLYTLVTGKYVHDAHSIREHLIAAATRRATPIRTLSPWVPEAVGAVIDRAIMFDKSERWPDAKSMHDALVAAKGIRGRVGSRADKTEKLEKQAPQSLRSRDVAEVVISAPIPNERKSDSTLQDLVGPELGTDEVATVMTKMTRELHDAIHDGGPSPTGNASTSIDDAHGEAASTDATLLAPSSQKLADANATESMPAFAPGPTDPLSRRSPGPMPPVPPPLPPVPPIPPAPSSAQAIAAPPPIARASFPSHHEVAPTSMRGPASMAPPAMRPSYQSFGEGPGSLQPLSQQAPNPVKTSSRWHVFLIVAIVSLLGAAAGTFAVKRFRRR